MLNQLFVRYAADPVTKEDGARPIVTRTPDLPQVIDDSRQVDVSAGCRSEKVVRFADLDCHLKGINCLLGFDGGEDANGCQGFCLYVDSVQALRHFEGLFAKSSRFVRLVVKQVGAPGLMDEVGNIRAFLCTFHSFEPIQTNFKAAFWVISPPSRARRPGIYPGQVIDLTCLLQVVNGLLPGGDRLTMFSLLGLRFT